MNAAVVEKAKKLAESGFTPIPLRGKVPQLKGWQEVGRIDAATIDQWVANGLLENVGLRTGDLGLVVLDFDGKPGYEAFVKAFGELADTYTVATGSGDGMHLYYHLTGELPKSSGQLNVPGGYVEIKAKGRQVVIPPSLHPDTGALYEVFNKAKARDLASFEPIQVWIDSFNAPKYEPVQREVESPATHTGGSANYAKSALQGMVAELTALGNVENDFQNTTLNLMAWKLAHYVARGDLSRGEVFNALEGAMRSNGYIGRFGASAFTKTFESGFQSGLSDNQYMPKVYQNGTGTAPRRELPGERAYEPPKIAREENGVTTIGRTRIIRRTSLFSDLTQRIFDDDYIPGAPPILFPLQCLHPLGGQARVTKAGKVIGLVGTSGSGKTSALETIADAYVAGGVPVWMWTPEWTPDEMAERVMQRYGGPTQDQLYLHEIDKWRVKTFGLPENPEQRLQLALKMKAMEALRVVNGWSSEVSFVENSLLTIVELGEVIAAAQSIVTPTPRVLIVDYVQLLKANEVDEKDDTSMYNLIQRFKSLCVYHGLIGILSTQTTKDEARQSGRQENFSGTVVLNCTKNSRGKRGKVRIKSDPQHLRLIDEPYPDQHFSSDDHYLGSQAGRFINDDAFNLWITLNPEYEEAV